MASLFADCTYHDIYAPIKSQTITFFKLIVKFEIDCERRDRENRNLEFFDACLSFVAFATESILQLTYLVLLTRKWTLKFSLRITLTNKMFSLSLIQFWPCMKCP